MYVFRRQALVLSFPLMPRGHLLSCATKKASKEVAGNAIPRSRLPSERKIAHSRVSSLYPYFDTKLRSREYFLNLRFNFPFELNTQEISGSYSLAGVLSGTGPPEGRRPACPRMRNPKLQPYFQFADQGQSQREQRRLHTGSSAKQHQPCAGSGSGWLRENIAINRTAMFRSGRAFK